MSSGDGSDTYGATVPAARHFLVYGSVRRPVFGGGHYLDWNEKPIGVFTGNQPEDACKAAAASVGTMGTFFAVEGTPWGIELMNTGAGELGRSLSANERISQHLDRMEELERQRQALEAQKHD